jgi:hypothetical protein
MAAQYKAMEVLSSICPVVKLLGWQKDGNGTSQIRKQLDLVKVKDKKAQTPEAHAVDGIALAASQLYRYGLTPGLGEDSMTWKGSVDVTPAPFAVITRPDYFRRALHFDNAAKGGIRKRKGGTVTPFGFRLGDKIQVKTKGIQLKGWVGGFTNTDKSKQVALYDQNWKRLGRFGLKQIQLLRRSNKLCVTTGG